jgi:hypothetical protein
MRTLLVSLLELEPEVDAEREEFLDERLRRVRDARHLDALGPASPAAISIGVRRRMLDIAPVSQRHHPLAAWHIHAKLAKKKARSSARRR